ncbi:MAG: glycosyl hydrolase family 18 protein [Clostridiales bacterium]|nr:glycosyl hydrolase family 18 protein [Clostridiales bacterium]
MKSNCCSDNKKVYIKIIKDTPLFADDGSADERWAVEGKIYRVISEEKGKYLIRFGSKKGWIPESHARKIDIVPETKLMVAWDYIPGKDANEVHYKSYININSTKQGLDVISPTWFTREGSPERPESIKVVDNADMEYVKIAHNHGFEVWGLIADFNYERNFTVYSSKKLVKKEIDEIVGYAGYYDLDGINIDFEGFGSRCRDLYSRYVMMLSQELKRYNFIVSVDVTKESKSDAWGKCYDRAEISKYVDFVAYMAYDEHGRLDVIPGSTGSLPWVREGIGELIDIGIPAEKILLGVPFYTRDWKIDRIEPEEKSVVIVEWENIGIYEKPDCLSRMLPLAPGTLLKYAGETKEWYRVAFNSEYYYVSKDISCTVEKGETLCKTNSVKSIAMKDIDKIKALKTADEYDKGAGQKKITYIDDEGCMHIIWIEDDKSMERRLKLVREYNLAGAAAWRLGYEGPVIWNAIANMLK